VSYPITRSALFTVFSLWSKDAVERQMSHMERNSVRAAYIHKAEHLDERKHSPDSISELQAIVRKPWPQTSTLVSYPITRSALSVERQMSHMERNSVRAAYIHKAEHLDERKLMLQWHPSTIVLTQLASYRPLYGSRGRKPQP
jgi:hypothetical protein